MGTPFHHVLTERIQLIGDRAVIDGVAQSQDGAADEVRIDNSFHKRFAAQLRPQADAQFSFEFGRERLGGDELHADAVLQDVVEDVKLAMDRPQAIQPAVPREDLRKFIVKVETRPPSTRSRIRAVSSGEISFDERTASNLEFVSRISNTSASNSAAAAAVCPAFSAASKNACT